MYAQIENTTRPYYYYDDHASCINPLLITTLRYLTLLVGEGDNPKINNGNNKNNNQIK